MKIRRTGHERDLRQLPLDATDMFLLTRVVGTVALAELLAIAPCEASEVRQRVQHLAKLGVIKLEGLDPHELLAGATVVVAGSEHDEDAVTLRPPQARAPAAGTQRGAARTTTRTFGRPRPD
jgi:hypothetical protein